MSGIKQAEIRYQINAVKNNIISKESRGEDAEFERSLLKSWASYEGWEYAKEAGDSCQNTPQHPCSAK